MGTTSAAPGDETTETASEAEPGSTDAAATDGDDAPGGPDEPGAGPLARARVLVPAYALAAVALTWPLATHAGDRLAYGTEPTSTVPLFNLWTLRWNQDRFAHLLSGYWDAPIFHPTGGAFALSEPQPLTGLLFAPAAWLSGNPVLAYNLVALAFLVLNGWAGARLARHLGAAPAPAAVVGVLALSLPFVNTQMGVLQLTAVFPLLGLVDAVVRWAPDGGRRAAAEAGLWLAAAFLTCGYYGLFAVTAIGPAALVLARRRWLTTDRLADLAVAALCFAPALPFVVGQARITADYTRTDETIEALSAGFGDAWELPGDARGAGLLPWVGDGGGGLAVYPGTVLLGLGVAGAVLAARRLGRDRRRVVPFLVVGALLARLLGMGLSLSILGFEPYQVVRDVVPGFESLRSPFRFAVLSEVFLLALAAFALDALWRWRPAGTSPLARRAGALAAVAIVVVGLAEVGIAPVELLRVDRAEPDWVAWLDDRRDQRSGGDGDEVVAFLPFPEDGRVASYVPTVEHMLQALDAGVATVNGYSGLWPPTYDRLEALARQVPSDDVDLLLRSHGVTVVVAEAAWLGTRPDVVEWLDATYERAFVGLEHVGYTVPPG